MAPTTIADSPLIDGGKVGRPVNMPLVVITLVCEASGLSMAGRLSASSGSQPQTQVA